MCTDDNSDVSILADDEEDSSCCTSLDSDSGKIMCILLHDNINNKWNKKIII